MQYLGDHVALGPARDLSLPQSVRDLLPHRIKHTRFDRGVSLENKTFGGVDQIVVGQPGSA